MTKYAYGYCKHGAYVGGCGVDYMCGACEMGDEDPTPRELLEIMQRAEARYDAKIVELEGLTIEWAGEGHKFISPRLILSLLRDSRVAFENAERTFFHVCQLANGMDDRDWLNRQHERNIQEFYEMDELDQMMDAPASVLDGGY